MKMTLLDMTQNILSRMSSDEVNSVSDTPESLQVANIIKNKYFDIISRVDVPEHDQLIQLDPSLDSTIPVQMYVPAGVAEIKWMKYFNSNVLDVASSGSHDINTDITSSTWTTTSTTSNTIALGAHTFIVAAGLSAASGQLITCVSGVNSMSGTVSSYSGTSLIVNITTVVGSGTFTAWTISQTSTTNSVPGYQYVTMLPITQFIEMVNSFNPGEDNVETFTFSDNSNNYDSNYTFYYRTDRQPTFCTILSNYYVIFDSIDSTQDSTLQGSKTMALGRIVPHFDMTDTFIPTLSDSDFQLLINEATSMAFFELKQQGHQLAMQDSKRGWTAIQKRKAVAERPTAFNALPDFGRRTYTGVSYFKSRGWDQRS